MPFFQYQARSAAGELHRGVEEGSTEAEVVRKLKAARLYPVKVKPVRKRRRQNVPEQHIVRFYKDLAELLEAGLPLDRALLLIANNETHSLLKRTVKSLFDEVQAGRDLSAAVDSQRQIFGDLAPHIIRAGEASGTLSMILKRFGEYLERRRAFRQQLTSALIYPSILLVMAVLSIIVLLVYVMPKFAQVFEDLQQQVPPFTRFLLNSGEFLDSYGWVLPILLAVGFWGGRYLLAKPRVRSTIDHLLLRVPVARNVIMQMELSRFCRTLGTMLNNGVPMVRALSLVDQVIVNTAVRDLLRPMEREVKMGRPMSEFFRTRTVFPSRMRTMLRISEEQGNLGGGLLELGRHFEEDLQTNLHRMVTLAEPLVIVFTGFVIGAMVISMFSAIFSISEVRF
jgi:general secretion pathway protein F